jgi:hypothetical protein
MIFRRDKFIRLAASAAVVGLATGAGGEMPEEPVQETVVVAVSEPAVVEPVAVDPVNDAQEVLPVRVARAGKYDNLFSGHSWYTPPPPPPVRDAPPPVRYEPTAPQLPYKLLGTYEQAGETLYFLVKGDRVYDVTIGAVLDDTYSVDGVTDGQLMFTYLPLQTSQGLRLGEQ